MRCKLEQQPPEKKRGRKKVYDSSKGYDKGAPRLATRVDPDVLEWVESRPEGKRPYIERVVREDKAKTENSRE